MWWVFHVVSSLHLYSAFFAPVHKKPQASPLFVVAFSILTSLEDIFWSLLFQWFMEENTGVNPWIWQSCEKNSSWPQLYKSRAAGSPVGMCTTDTLRLLGTLTLSCCFQLFHNPDVYASIWQKNIFKFWAAVVIAAVFHSQRDKFCLCLLPAGWRSSSRCL